MGAEPNVVHVRGSFEHRRGPSVVVVLILAAVGLAIVKPWSIGQPGSTTAPSPTGHLGAGDVATAPPPTPVPRVDPNGMACLGGDVEQVVAFDRNARDEVRNWIAVEDVPVAGPLDPSMARITIHSSHIVGLGVCGKFAVDGLPVAGRLQAVSLIATTPDGPAIIDLGFPRQITLELGDPDAAVLYGPPARSGASVDPASPSAAVGDGRAGLATWPTGLYALAFMFASDRPSAMHWLGIDLLPSADAPR